MSNMKAKEVAKILVAARLAMQKCLSIQLIGQERLRQIDELGWSGGHDDHHIEFELTKAAIAHAVHAIPDAQAEPDVSAPPWWPWDETAWKPDGDPIRHLVKAGALIAAEIDRLVRLEER